MNSIQGFLDKIKERIWDKNPDKAQVAAVLSKKLTIQISEKNLSIRNNTLICMVSPILKSEINLKKKELLLAIQEVVPKGSILDIR